MNPHQIVFQFAAQVFDLLLFLEMREKPIEQKELRLPPGHRAPYAGEVVQLSKCPCERSFTALIRTRHDKNPFSPFQMKVIANN